VEVLKTASYYCSLALPFMSAAWLLLLAKDELRGKAWRQALNVVLALASIIYGVLKLLQ